MRIVRPVTEYRSVGVELAERPGDLNGKVVGFCDGWGRRLDDSTYGMYPTMDAIREALEERFVIGGVFWARKPNCCQPIPRGMLVDFASRVDVIVNGECI